jgi:hypothetical protein
MWEEAYDSLIDYTIQFIHLPFTNPLVTAARYYGMLYVSPVIYLLMFLYIINPDAIKRIAYLYVGKMILNLFRQINGYKEGKYIKIWDKEKNLEDNYFLVKFLKEVEGEDLSVNDIIQFLTKSYELVVETERRGAVSD